MIYCKRPLQSKKYLFGVCVLIVVFYNICINPTTENEKIRNKLLYARREHNRHLDASKKHDNGPLDASKEQSRLLDTSKEHNRPLDASKEHNRPLDTNKKQENWHLDLSKKHNWPLDATKEHKHWLFMSMKHQHEPLMLRKHMNNKVNSHKQHNLHSLTINLLNNEKTNIQDDMQEDSDADENKYHNNVDIMETDNINDEEEVILKQLLLIKRLREQQNSNEDLGQGHVRVNSNDRNSEKIAQQLSDQGHLYKGTHSAKDHDTNKQKASPAMVESTLLEPKISICKSTKIKFVIMVISAASNLNQRNAIRQTWLMPIKHSKDQQYVFLLGNPANKTIQKNVEAEHDIHGDIIQGTFSDTYRNLTLKTMLALHWFSTHCPFADFLIKVDDDVHMNTDLLIDWLDKLNQTYPHVHQRALIGAANINNKVVRNTTHRWYVSRKTYSKSTYPTYMSGPAYIISGQVARDIARIMWKVPYIEMEDTFVGLAAEQLPYKVHIMDYNTLYYMWGWRWKDYMTDLINGDPILFIHKVSSKNQHILWELWKRYNTLVKSGEK